MLDEASKKAHECKDPHPMCLVLGWVYGAFVPPADKARDAAKRTPGQAAPYSMLSKNVVSAY